MTEVVSVPEAIIFFFAMTFLIIAIGFIPKEYLPSPMRVFGQLTFIFTLTAFVAAFSRERTLEKVQKNNTEMILNESDYMKGLSQEIFEEKMAPKIERVFNLLF